MSEELKSLATLLGLILASALFFAVIVVIIFNIYANHETQNQSKD